MRLPLKRAQPRLTWEDSDDFETAIFADTLLGELGSSSGSHKGDPDEFEDQAVIDGDSGASDSGSRPVNIETVDGGHILDG